MRDHRDIEPGDAPILREITKAVQQHSTKHPRSVRRAMNTDQRKKVRTKMAKRSRRANR